MGKLNSNCKVHTTGQKKSEMLRKNLNYLDKFLRKTVEGKCIQEKNSESRESTWQTLPVQVNSVTLGEVCENIFFWSTVLGVRRWLLGGKEYFSCSLNFLSPRTSSFFPSIQKIIKQSLTSFCSPSKLGQSVRLWFWLPLATRDKNMKNIIISLHWYHWLFIHVLHYVQDMQHSIGLVLWCMQRQFH